MKVVYNSHPSIVEVVYLNAKLAAHMQIPGADPGFFKRRGGGVETWAQLCCVKWEGRFADFKQCDVKIYNKVMLKLI